MILKAWKAGDEGQTLVEYGLVISLVSIALIGGLVLLGVDIGAIFTTIENKMK